MTYSEEDIERAIRAARGADPSGGMYYREARPIVLAVIQALSKADDTDRGESFPAW